MSDARDLAVIRLPAVERKIGYKRAWIWKNVEQGEFPPPIKLGARAVGWLEHEVDNWIEERIRESRGTA